MVTIDKNARSKVADQFFESVDIGDVADASGWEYESPGNDWGRQVFLTADEPGEPSVAAWLSIEWDGERIRSASLNGEDVVLPEEVAALEDAAPAPGE